MSESCFNNIRRRNQNEHDAIQLLIVSLIDRSLPNGPWIMICVLGRLSTIELHITETVCAFCDLSAHSCLNKDKPTE